MKIIVSETIILLGIFKTSA